MLLIGPGGKNSKQIWYLIDLNLGAVLKISAMSGFRVDISYA